MSTELLKEVLLPFNTKELEYFNEATANCTDEQRLAVAKRLSEEKLPEGWQFTKAQIERFIAQDGYSKINWFRGMKKAHISERDLPKDVQRANTYRAQSDRMMADACGFTREQRQKLGIKETSPEVDEESTVYKQLRQLRFSEADAKKLIRSGFKF